MLHPFIFIIEPLNSLILGLNDPLESSNTIMGPFQLLLPRYSLLTGLAYYYFLRAKSIPQMALELIFPEFLIGLAIVRAIKVGHAVLSEVLDEFLIA